MRNQFQAQTDDGGKTYFVNLYTTEPDGTTTRNTLAEGMTETGAERLAATLNRYEPQLRIEALGGRR